MDEYNDKALRCIDCEEEFIFTAGEQLFFADKGLKNDPKRCKPCKSKKNDRIAANMHSFGQPFPRERVEVSVRCALCELRRLKFMRRSLRSACLFSVPTS